MPENPTTRLSNMQAKLVRWMHSVKVIPEDYASKGPECEPNQGVPEAKSIGLAFQNGVMLCQLVASLEVRAGRRNVHEVRRGSGIFTLSGSRLQPKTTAAELQNINTALKVLRKRQNMNERHLWSAHELQSGSLAAIWELLEDIYRSYTSTSSLSVGEVVRKSTTNRGLLRRSAGKSSRKPSSLSSSASSSSSVVCSPRRRGRSGSRGQKASRARSHSRRTIKRGAWLSPERSSKRVQIEFQKAKKSRVLNSKNKANASRSRPHWYDPAPKSPTRQFSRPGELILTEQDAKRKSREERRRTFRLKASRTVSQNQVWEAQKRKHKFRLNSGAGGIMTADGTIASDYVSQSTGGGYAFKPLGHQEEGEVRGWLHKLGFKIPLDTTVSI